MGNFMALQPVVVLLYFTAETEALCVWKRGTGEKMRRAIFRVTVVFCHFL